jgi:hypothetical protein
MTILIAFDGLRLVFNIFNKKNYFSCHGINKSTPIFAPFRVEQMEHTD